MFVEFKKFLMRGNVVDLAVAVVMGVAFKAVVDSFVADVVMPIIGIPGGEPNFDRYRLTIHDSVIRWGAFLTAVVQFVSIAAAVFVMVKAYEALQARRRAGEEEPPEPTTEEALLTEIRDLLAARD